MKSIKLKITTPEKVVLEQDIDQITLPTQMGEITILPNHIPLISVIVPGTMETKAGKNLVSMAISGGFLEFHNNELVILADTAERAEEIDLQRAEKARKKAEQMKRDARKTLDEGQYAAVISQIEKQLARIRAAKKYRPRTRHGMTLHDKQ